MTENPPTSTRHAARRSRTDEKIATAVLDISRCQGLGAVTIEAVADLSGVAKTSIYRRYKNCFEMLSGVLQQLPPPDPEEPELSQQGLVNLLIAMKETFQERMGLTMIGSLLTSDEQFIREWRDKVIAPHTDALQRFFVRGVQAGILTPGFDQDLMHELILGGLIMEDIVRGEVSDDWAERTVTTLWPVLRSEQTP